MRERGKYSAMIGICMVLATLVAPIQATITWSPGSPPKDGEILQPVANGVYACGTNVQCACIPAVDMDLKTIDGPCPVTTEETDSKAPGYPLWVVIGGGSWKDGDNTGVGPVWIAPDNPLSDISFRMYDEDLPKTVYWPETGTRDDIPPAGSPGFLQDTKSGISAIVPVVDLVQYSAYGSGRQNITDVESPEYDRASGRNEPGAWIKDSQAVAIVKFWHALQLSQTVNVVVCGLTYGDGNNITLWDECGPMPWTTTWPGSAGFSCPGLTRIRDSIESHKYLTLWLYRCPAGSDNPILSTVIFDCELFGVYDCPVACPSGDYVKKNIRWACDHAHDANTIIGVADKIHSALAGDTPKEPGECEPNELCGDWNLLEGCPYYGECDEQARFMVSVLNLLGVGGAYDTHVYASQDAGAGHCIALDSRVENDELQWLIMDFDLTEEHAPNAFEGTAVVLDEGLEDFWYAVWPSYKATDDYDMLLKLPCEQWWVTTYNDIPPGTSDEWQVAEWREQIAKP